MIEAHRYVIYAEDATSDPLFMGYAETIEEARKIKFDAELAGFTGLAIIEVSLNKVE